MSNKTAAAVAAMVMALAAAPLPAEAHKGLSEKQIKALIKREAAKIMRQVQGPAGPAGPAGLGLPGPQGPAGPAGIQALTLSAFVLDEQVDPNLSVGITQENLRVDFRLIEGFTDSEGNVVPDVIATEYCFSGLPPVIGGQLTMHGGGGYAAVVSPKLELNTAEGCPVRVTVHGFEQLPGDHREPPIPASFYILLY